MPTGLLRGWKLGVLRMFVRVRPNTVLFAMLAGGKVTVATLLMMVHAIFTVPARFKQVVLAFICRAVGKVKIKMLDA